MEQERSGGVLFGDEIIGDEIIGDEMGYHLGGGGGFDDLLTAAGIDSMPRGVADTLARYGHRPMAPPPRGMHPAHHHRHQMRIAREFGGLPLHAGVNAYVNARAVDYRGFDPNKVRNFPLGFVQNNPPVAAGAVANLTAQPQIPFKGERLIVSSDIGGLFLILDLKVGKNSQIPSGQFGIPARAFSEFATDMVTHLDTASTSQFITLSIQNISSQPSPFFASLRGTYVEELGHTPSVWAVTFLSGLFRGEHERAASNQVVGILLEALAQCCEVCLEQDPDLPHLYASGVQYHVEPPGLEEWQDVITTLERGWGDCEDLVGYRVADLRRRWRIPAKPHFTFRKIKPNVTMYHILVKYPPGSLDRYGGFPPGLENEELTSRRCLYAEPDGSIIEDPSRILGMGGGKDRDPVDYYALTAAVVD